MTPNGCLDILNCNLGHMKVSFDKGDPADVAKAKRMIQDMLKRGYAILVETPDGSTRRVKRFDPETAEYIVDDAPAPAKGKRGGYRSRRLPMESTKATGVGRTAGG